MLTLLSVELQNYEMGVANAQFPCATALLQIGRSIIKFEALWMSLS